jgi:hypothetical protein
MQDSYDTAPDALIRNASQQRTFGRCVLTEPQQSRYRPLGAPMCTQVLSEAAAHL